MKQVRFHIFSTFASKVDVIVSEWMGYFLLRESMLDSVVVARWAKDTFYLHVPNVLLHASILWSTSNASFEQCKVNTASKRVLVPIPLLFSGSILLLVFEWRVYR